MTSGNESRCLAGFLFDSTLGCVDFCDDSKCFHGGTCAKTLSSFNCSCPPGWSGDRCEIDVDECNTGSLQSAVYHNGATCVNYAGGFKCSCQPGWQGALCNLDIDECLFDSPCRNGASCLNTDGGYVCKCEDGWTGEDCNRTLNHQLLETNGHFYEVRFSQTGLRQSEASHEALKQNITLQGRTFYGHLATISLKQKMILLLSLSTQRRGNQSTTYSKKRILA